MAAGARPEWDGDVPAVEGLTAARAMVKTRGLASEALGVYDAEDGRREQAVPRRCEECPAVGAEVAKLRR